jgi:hypothetical protein
LYGVVEKSGIYLPANRDEFMSLTIAQNLIKEFGLSLRMDALSLDGEGACQLLFDQQWLVSIVYASDNLLCSCSVASPDLVRRLPSAILLEILQENFMTCINATVSIAPDHRAYLQLSSPLAISDVKSLQTAVEHLINRSEYWSERFAKVQLKLKLRDQSSAMTTQLNANVGRSKFGIKHHV